ncbi:MAG TPA: response regulator [Geobacteraceae bacterium]
MSLVGNLEDLGLGEILQIVSLSRKSGILTLRSGKREGVVVFRHGQVVRAKSSTYQQNLGEGLLHKGLIDRPLLKKALAIQEEEDFKERLGTILVKRFGVSAQAIEEVVCEQIENVVYSLFAWAEGTFDFELQDSVEVSDSIKMDPVQFMLDQGLNPQFLAMEGSRLLDERRHRGEIIDEEMGEEEIAQPTAEDHVDIDFDLVHAGEENVEVAGIAPEEKRHLVLVDDDAVTLDVLADLLTANGWDVTSRARTEDALIAVDTLYRGDKRPTVLVDLIMPRMDGSGILGGLELLELVRSNFPDLPVLVMADYHNSDAERKVRGMGVAFLMKPRKTEISLDDARQVFGKRLLAELKKVESGEGPAEWSDQVNIGEELRLEMGEEPESSVEPVGQSTGLSLLRGMLEELNNPSLGGGIILLVLRFASEFMNRAVIFFVKRDEIVGLGQFGIEDSEGHADSKVRSMRIPRGEETFFSTVIESLATMKVLPTESRWNRYLFDQLGGGTPEEILLGPIVSEGKVVAVLYGDNLPENKPIGDTDSLEIFLSQAGLAMEKALLQRRLKEKGPEDV